MSLQFENEIKDEIGYPKEFGVYLLNDDYTSMDFVVEILMRLFHKNVEEAHIIMMDVHKNGKGLCGVYPYEIAETKAHQVKVRARESGFPLKTHIEEM